VTKTILIVEDEILVAVDIERILVDAGYEIFGIAADRETALQQRGEADIAFVDINLRDGLTGPAIACDLADRHGTKIIYLTANPAQIDRVAATAIGYIVKPFSDSAIRAAADLAANGRNANDPVHAEITLFAAV
jgi:DNA-binding response OmpR family regulator